MIKEKINFQQTHLFSNLMIDYINQKTDLQPFYHYPPTEANFRQQTLEKKAQYQHRKTLYNALIKQYKGQRIHQKVSENLAALQSENTFTVTTGHQLNLFTGPLYFIYKILCVINICEKLNAEKTEFSYVPVYWMATEDHDFEEINHFSYEQKIIRWNNFEKGAVGKFQLTDIQAIYDTLQVLLPPSDKKDYILKLFETSYLQVSNLAQATRILVNLLFESYGLIIIDGDDKNLKSLMIPYFKEDLEKNTAFEKVTKINQELTQLGYKIQVNPREINLFYLGENSRERITYADNQYYINNTTLSFSRKEMMQELENHPERFSPNVMLRPLYQEVILPNIAYVGGGGEIAYWLQLQSFFESQKVVFPILKLRNSVLIVTESIREKMNRNAISIPDLFSKEGDLFAQKVAENTELELSLENYRSQIKISLEALKKTAKQTDKSLENTILAQEKKWNNTIDLLEKKLLKAEKKKQAIQLEIIQAIFKNIHPAGRVQERFANISEMIMLTQKDFVQQVQQQMKPFEDEFIVLTF